MHTNNRNHQHQESPQGRHSVKLVRLAASFSVALVALLSSWALLAPSQCLGQVIMREDLTYPLIENEPFDLLTLDRSNKGAVIRILPPENLKLPLPERGDLVFEFAEDGELPLEVPYSAIVKYETFSDLLLEEANAMMDQGDLSRAFRNLLYVYDHGGKSKPEVDETLRACLFLDAREKFESGKYEIALSIFEDIYQKRPNFKVPGLNKPLIAIVLACYDGILKKKLERGQYEAIRQSLDNVNSRYGPDAKRLVRTWNARFNNSADEFLEAALELAKQGKGREAHLKTKQAERISPGRRKTEEVQAEILAQFPLVVVGVSQGGGAMDPGSLDHWGSRRVGRLIQRSLVEITGLSDEGAKYEFLNGSISRIDNVGLKYVFNLDPEPSQMVPAISAFQLATRLLAFADPVNDFYNETWAKILATVEVQSETRVVVTLQRPFVRPEALMQIPYPTSLFDPDVDTRNPMNVQNGLFKLTSNEEGFSFFGANEIYLGSDVGKHPVVIEQSFKTDTDAIDALLKGEVDVVDRIPPADYRDSRILIRFRFGPT
jgi:tetratricopeptide (TPR) repeat protein